jgi:hypothetical protein
MEPDKERDEFADLEYHVDPEKPWQRIYVKGCRYCESEREAGNTFFPSHVPSRGCRSGRRPHCTCDTCF